MLDGAEHGKSNPQPVDEIDTIRVHFHNQMSQWRITESRLNREIERLEEERDDLRQSLERAKIENRALFDMTKTDPTKESLRRQLEQVTAMAEWEKKVFDNEIERAKTLYDELEVTMKRKIMMLAMISVGVWVFMITAFFLT